FRSLAFLVALGDCPPCSSVLCTGESDSDLSVVLLEVEAFGLASFGLGSLTPAGWSCVVGWPPCWARASSRASKVMVLSLRRTFSRRGKAGALLSIGQPPCAGPSGGFLTAQRRFLPGAAGSL